MDIQKVQNTSFTLTQHQERSWYEHLLACAYVLMLLYTPFLEKIVVVSSHFFFEICSNEKMLCWCDKDSQVKTSSPSSHSTHPSIAPPWPITAHTQIETCLANWGGFLVSSNTNQRTNESYYIMKLKKHWCFNPN